MNISNYELLEIGTQLKNLIEDMDWNIIKRIREDDYEDDITNAIIDVRERIDKYDPGYLNTYDHKDDWHTYISSLLEEAHQHYIDQIQP